MRLQKECAICLADALTYKFTFECQHCIVHVIFKSTVLENKQINLQIYKILFAWFYFA